MSGQLRTALQPIADSFKNSEQTDQQDVTRRGWGQFLDIPRTHNQIGLYGTAAGCLVLALATRAPQISKENIAILCDKWFTRDNAAAVARMRAQTLRVAFLFMTLRTIQLHGAKLPTDAIKELSELESDLLRRSLSGQGWGNWWQDTEHYDRGPSVFTTAIVILAFATFRSDSQPLPPAVLTGVQYLEQQLSGRQELSPIHAAAALTALAAVKKQEFPKDNQERLLRLFSTLGQTLSQPIIYFYDFEYAGLESSTAFARDYFIVPCGLLLGIASAYAAASNWRVQVELGRVTDWLTKVLKEAGGRFRPYPDQYASTKDQAWVALFIAIATVSYGKSSLVQRFSATMLGHKPDTWWWSVSFPIIILLAIGLMILEVGPGSPWMQWAGHSRHLPDWLVHLPLIFLSAIEGAVLHRVGPRISRKILPGY